jgi:hypothetical protein
MACKALALRSYQLTQEQRQRADAANAKSWFPGYWITKEEAWHNNHGMGMEFQATCAALHAEATSDYSEHYCRHFAKEVEDLNDCIRMHVRENNFSSL